MFQLFPNKSCFPLKVSKYIIKGLPQPILDAYFHFLRWLHCIIRIKRKYFLVWYNEWISRERDFRNHPSRGARGRGRNVKVPHAFAHTSSLKCKQWVGISFFILRSIVKRESGLKITFWDPWKLRKFWYFTQILETHHTLFKKKIVFLSIY